MKNGFNNLSLGNKKIVKQKNVNLKSKLYLFLLIISLVNPISENKSRYLNTYDSEIKLVIKGNVIQPFLNPNFYSKLSKVSINGNEYFGVLPITTQFEKNMVVFGFEEQIETCRKMFYNIENMVEIDLSSFDASKVKDMFLMFSGCSNLEKIEFANINTYSLENMAGLFQGCSKLSSIHLSYFDTSKVIDMSYMFNGCTNLEKIEFGNINTSSLVNMSSLFQGCSKMASIDLSNLYN